MLHGTREEESRGQEREHRQGMDNLMCLPRKLDSVLQLLGPFLTCGVWGHCPYLWPQRILSIPPYSSSPCTAASCLSPLRDHEPPELILAPPMMLYM